ncbi:hypothetical protein BURC_01974 [Burkholderiaceae bacterium]|nr:hypothetical protein BURC_01974 [Burkholderiaceae bacterium]
MTLGAVCQTRVTGERQTPVIDLALIAMRHELTPTRTPMASEWLTEPSAPLDLAHRVLLATVDGRRHIVELESVARALGLRTGALHRLRAQGLVAFGESASEDDDGDRTRRAAPAPATHWLPARLPLQSATWYAVELACVMLARDDPALRAAARDIDSSAALLDWCERCAETIARECGQERADLFFDKIFSTTRAREPVMPDDEDRSPE